MLLWITLFNIHSDANVFTFYNDREKKTCIHCMCVYMYSSKHLVFSLKMNATSTWQGIFLQPYLDCKKNFFWFLSWSWTWGGGGWTLLIFWITYRSRKKNIKIQMKVVTFYGLIEWKKSLGIKVESMHSLCYLQFCGTLSSGKKKIINI